MKHLVVIAGLFGLASSPTLALPFASGDIFAATGAGQVKVYSNAGVLKQTLSAGSGTFTTGMAFDGAGNLYSTNFDAGTITRYNPNGAVILPNPFISPGLSPESIVFNTSGSFYVGRAGGAVQRFNAAGVLQQTYSMTQNTDWIDLAANQTTLFYNDESGSIRRWDLATNTALGNFATTQSGGGSASFALRILSNGHVLSAANTKVIEFDATGAVLGSYDATGIDGFFALNLDPDGKSFWTGSFANQQLYRFTIGGFGVDTFTQSFNTGGDLYGVALAGEITVGGPPTDNGVPEPATWALMIVGFGMVGVASRRRHRPVTA